MLSVKPEKMQNGKKPRKISVSAFILFILLCLFLWQASKALLPILTGDIFESEVNRRRQSIYTGVITIWQIDSFEGGKGSRTAWLNKTLASLERSYNGVYITVRSVTLSQAKLLIAAGDFDVLPDMISFGGGMITDPEKLLIALEENLRAPIRPDLKEACGKYAVPWCYGGYVLLMDSEQFAKHAGGEKTLADLPSALNELGGTVRYGKGTRDIFALGVAGAANVNYAEAVSRVWKGGCLNGKYALKSFSGDINFSVWDAYNNAKSLCAMLGTQRDLYRMVTAESQNKSRPTTVFPVPGYTDLIQCMGIVKTTDDKKLEIMKNILAYLTQTDVQAGLSDIGLFPAAVAAEKEAEYEDERVRMLFEAVSKGRFEVGSVYEDAQNIQKRTAQKINYLQNG